MTNKKVLYLTEMGVLIAILLIMSFTPLGYLPVGAISVSLLTIPVVIGAIVLGPTAGAILGFIFGITSFVQCFGTDAFGTFLFSINPFYTFIMCVGARTLMGFLTGLIFKGLRKIDKTKVISYAITSLCGALLNTLLFCGLLLILFWPKQSETKQYIYIPFTAETEGTYSFSTTYAVPEGIKGDVYLDLFTTDYEKSYSTRDYNGVTYHESQYEFLGNGSATIWMSNEAQITKNLKKGDTMLIGLTDNNGVAYFDKVDVILNEEVVKTFECEEHAENYGSSEKNQGQMPTVVKSVGKEDEPKILTASSQNSYVALNNPSFQNKMKLWGFPIDNVWVFIIAFVGINAVFEAIVCTLIGTAISKALDVIINKKASKTKKEA